MPKFKNKDGSLTPYAFACGYIQERKLKNCDETVSLSKDGCWHVKAFRGCERLLWECFDTLKEARQCFRNAEKLIKL